MIKQTGCRAIRIRRNENEIELDKADIIVAGGMGLGSSGFKELTKIVEQIQHNGQNVNLVLQEQQWMRVS